MRYMKAFISILALLLLTFVVVGLILPGEWSTVRERVVRAPRGAVLDRIQDLRNWTEWSAMGQVEGEYSEPSSGAGATLSWDDPQWGQGVFTLTDAGDEGVGYRVQVEDGSIRTTGAITLEPVEEGTRVVWREEGDFGWNPLLSWFALGMDRLQGQELEKGLDRLQEAVEGR